MKVRLLIILLFVLSSYHQVIAQLPVSNIYDLSYHDTSETWMINNIKLISSFNKNGYNNQLFPLQKNRFYLSSNQYSDSTTEIINLDFNTNILTRITNNNFSEYSPQQRPNHNDILSVVSVNEQNHQNIKLYDLSNEMKSRILFPEMNNVAYYNWLNEDLLAICQLTAVADEMNLLIADVELGNYKTKVENVGRCIKSNEEQDNILYFVHKLTSQYWYLKQIDLNQNLVTIIVQMLPNVEDFELLEDGSFIIGKDASIYRFNPEMDDNWKKICDLSKYGLMDIKRICHSNNHFLVCNVK